MSTDPVAVLEAIVAEVAGAGRPFSADSFCHRIWCMTRDGNRSGLHKDARRSGRLAKRTRRSCLVGWLKPTR